MTAIPEPFTITSRVERGCHVLTLQGDLDLDTAPELEHTLCVCGNGRPIIADITELTFISSAGIHLLLRDEAKNAPNALVRTPHSNVARVLELVDAKRRLPLFDNLDDALARLAEVGGEAEHPAFDRTAVREAHAGE
jgi:anti-anti-sigma factor